MQKKTEDVSLSRIGWEFFKVGTFTLGGGTAMIPQIQAVVVDEKKWLSEDEMLDCVAIGQALPGVIAVNMATFIGYKQRGLLGAIVATVGVILPAFLAIIIAVGLLDFIGDNKFVEGAFVGVKAAVCGLITVSAGKLLIQMCKKAIRDYSDDSTADNSNCNGAHSKQGKRYTKLQIANIILILALSIVSFVAVGFLGLTAILLIVIGMMVGLIFHLITYNASASDSATDKTLTSKEVKR